jgi:hypothetical protein
MLQSPNSRFLAPALQNSTVVSSDQAQTGDRGDGVSYRTFLDTTGRRWEVWLVTPAAAERRKADRRAAASGRVDDAQGFADRRHTPERRRNPFRRTIEVATEFSQGWLCFESEGEKRRLAPVPDGWDESGPDRLGTWLQAAKRVVKCAP